MTSYIENELEYPEANDYWKNLIIEFIKAKKITKEDLYSLNKGWNPFVGDYVIDDKEYREAIGEREYHIDLLWKYLFERCEFEEFMVDAIERWMHENNSEEDLDKSGWNDWEYYVNELVYSEADMNGLIRDIIENLTDEELKTLIKD